MMNLNPWNVASIEEFSYLNCPECDFHTKEKKNFQDHATKNHPLSAVLFSKEVISFLNELNQLERLSNNQKCKELELKHRLPDNDNIEKGQVQIVLNQTKKGFTLPTEIVKILPLQKEEKLENSITTFHPSQSAIPCEDQNECSGGLREELLDSNETINFSDIPVKVMEVDYNNLIPSKLQQNFIQIDSLNSDVLISSVNFDKFQEFQTVLPNDTELTVSSVHDQIECLICGQSFPSKNQLKEHTTSVHDEVKQYPCSKCGKCFSRIKSLLDHIFIVHEEKKQCDYKSKLKENMKSHTVRVHAELDVREIHDGKQNLHCEICNVSFVKEINLKLHQKSRHHKKEILNRNAPVQLKSKKKLEKSNNKIIESTNIATSTKHTLLMSKKELQNCKLCNHSFETKSNLNKHIVEVHELKKPFECNKQNWRCDICNESFKKKVDLQVHKRIRHDTIKKSNEKELIQKDENPENCHKKEKTIAKVDRTTVLESKKSRNIANLVSKKALRNQKGKQYHIIKKSNEKEQVQKDENQKEITVFNEFNENQTPENGHSKEKTIAKVDSSTVHESKKSRNGLAISDDVPLSNVDLDGHPTRPLRPSLPTGLLPTEQPKWKSQPRLTQPPPLVQPPPGLPPVGLPPGPIARPSFRPQHPQQFQHR